MILEKFAFTEGCDVSYWQGNIDFEKMVKAGIKFVLIRAGYGQNIDKNFVTYINKAIKVGLKVGVYWFLYATDERTGLKNAIKCMQVIEPYKDLITMGVWGDWEYDSDKYAGNLSNTERSNILDKFLHELEINNYEVGIYSNSDYILHLFRSEIVAKYPLWYAKYSKCIDNTGYKGKDKYPYIWQYTSKGAGKDYGVQTKNIDLDYGYVTDKTITNETILDKVESDPKVIKAYDNPYPVPTRVIYYNAGSYLQRGDDVKWCQWHLWRCGVLLKDGIPDASQIDGIWGKKSHAACIEVQKRLGLPQTGCIDSGFRNTLLSL